MPDSMKLIIDEKLASSLVSAQFPQWKDLLIKPVATSGWDNRTFHLGEDMLIRLPSAARYATQVEKEHKWLPKLAPLLPLPIPVPLAVGEPEYGYPWSWSIYRWLPGESAATARIKDMSILASDLAQFLIALEHIDSTEGPQPGTHSFYRGGELKVYDAETRQAIAKLEKRVDAKGATKVWEAALESTWDDSPVWVHGDMSVGNLLVQGGRLSAVIDFGQLTVGDPACDLAPAWTLFEGDSRDVFCAKLAFDTGTWNRGRGWVLWKALIMAVNLADTNSIELSHHLRVIDDVIEDYGRNNRVIRG